MFWFVIQLIDDYPRDPEVKELVDKYDWYLLPIVNPDGYSYTWSKVTENLRWQFFIVMVFQLISRKHKTEEKNF